MTGKFEIISVTWTNPVSNSTVSESPQDFLANWIMENLDRDMAGAEIVNIPAISSVVWKCGICKEEHTGTADEFGGYVAMSRLLLGIEPKTKGDAIVAIVIMKNNIQNLQNDLPVKVDDSVTRADFAAFEREIADDH